MEVLIAAFDTSGKPQWLQAQRRDIVHSPLKTPCSQCHCGLLWWEVALECITEATDPNASLNPHPMIPN